MSMLVASEAPPAEYLDTSHRAESAPPPRGGVEELLAVLRQLHTSEADLDGALRLVVDKARELLQVDLAWGGTISDGLLTTTYTSGTRTDALMTLQANPLTMTLSGAALQRQHTLVINNYPAYQYRTTPEIRKAAKAEGVIAAMIAPLFLGDQLVGFVNVANRRPVAFGAVHSSLLSTLAAQASVAMVNGMLQGELRTRNAMLAESLTVHRELTASAVRGAGVAGLLERLEQILGRPVELTTEPTEQPRQRAGARIPVLARDERLGWLAVPGEPLAPAQLHALRHAASAIALELLSQRAAQRSEERMRAEFLEELVHASRPPSAALARRALRLGYSPGVPVRLVAIEIVSGTSGSDALHHDVREVLERDATARGTGPAMTYERTGRIVAALPGEADCDDAAVHLHDQLTAVGWRVAMGVGRASTDLVSARSEAFACLELARKAGATAIVDAARLGPLRFMLDEPDLASAVAVVRERLTPLVGADRNGDGSLLETARAYADADGHQRTTTARCGIHVNTLKYRLARIEELVGYSLRDPERRYALRLAFQLLDLLQTLGLKPLDSRSDGDAR